MAIVAVLGRKGGIGKSTIVGNLAAEFEEMGKSVAVLDADPQHSLTSWASQGEGLLSRCVGKVKESSADGLAGIAHKAGKSVDIVLIDTPPGITDITYQAAIAADLVLLPCGPSPLDLLSLKGALSLALKARAERGSKKPRIRFVPSKVVMTTNLGRGLCSSLEAMGKKVLPPICQRTAVAEAAGKGLTVREYPPASASRTEFEALAQAVEAILTR